MSEPGFYNSNTGRSYPFLRGQTGRPEQGPLTLAQLPPPAVVDAGFILGAGSGFDASAHQVQLVAVRRHGDLFTFEFACSAPALYGVPLVFTRHADDVDYLLEYADSGMLGVSGSSQSGQADECEEPLWSGFMVSGPLASLGLFLAGDGEVTGTAAVEPALVQNLAGGYVTRLALANDDRTRTTAPAGCPPVVWPYETGVVHVAGRCLVGDIAFRAGFNAVVRQGLADNSITLAAAVGAGEGEPCDQVRLFPGEEPPEGSSLLEGGPRCNETLRSINGVGGRLFLISAGTGVTVTSVPVENRVVIDVNLGGLAVQYRVSASSQSC